jgi:hypothetical protein
MADNTLDGFNAWEEQAEPLDAAIPFSPNVDNKVAPSIKLTHQLQWWGSR